MVRYNQQSRDTRDHDTTRVNGRFTPCQSASQIDVYSSRLNVRDQLEGYPCGKAYMITMQTGMAR